MPIDNFGRFYFSSEREAATQPISFVTPNSKGATQRTAADKVSMASYQAPGGYDADGRPLNAPEPTAFKIQNPPSKKTVGTVHSYGSTTLVQNWLRIVAYDYALGLRMSHNHYEFQAKEDNFQESLGKLHDAIVAATAVKYEAIIELRVAESVNQQLAKAQGQANVEARNACTRRIADMEATIEGKVRDAKNEIRKQYLEWKENERDLNIERVRTVLETFRDAADEAMEQLEYQDIR